MAERIYRLLIHDTLRAINDRAARFLFAQCMTEAEIDVLDHTHGYAITWQTPTNIPGRRRCLVTCERNGDEVLEYWLDMEDEIYHRLPEVVVGEDGNPVDYRIHFGVQAILEYVAHLAAPDPQASPQPPEVELEPTHWGIEQIEAWECDDCDSLDVETAEMPLWDCPECGHFAAKLNRCPQCGRFSPKVDDDSCAHCNAGQLTPVEAWLCLHCDSIYKSEAEARNCCPVPGTNSAPVGHSSEG